MGEFDQGLQQLRQLRWPKEREISLQAKHLEGLFLSGLGFGEQSLQAYKEGVEMVARIQRQLVGFYDKRGRKYLQEKELDEAWRETQLARYEAANLSGVVLTQRGQFEEGLAAYKEALTVATTIQYDRGIAKTNRDIADLLWRRNQLTDAAKHATEAVHYYERIQDDLNVAWTHNTLACIHMQSGAYESAVTAGLKALSFLERIGHTYSIAGVASNLAESYFELDQLDAAEKYVHDVLRLEETQSQPYALFTLAGIARKRQDYPQAERVIAETIQLATNNRDKFLAAYAYRLSGEIELDQGRSKQASTALDQAITLFETMGLTSEKEKSEQLRHQT